MKLRAEHVVKSFRVKGKSVFALKDLDFEIDLDNDICALVGPNGSGKTTFFRILCGILYPLSGGVFVNNAEVDIQWAKSHINYIPSGERNLFQRNTVFENAFYYGVLRGGGVQEVEEQIFYYAKMLQCEKILGRWLEGMSSGERKKASLLAALCSGSQILLVDEPTWGLDFNSVLALQELFCIIKEETSKDILISSHDTLFLSGISNKYIFLQNGICQNIVENCLTVDELVEKCRSGGEGNDVILV